MILPTGRNPVFVLGESRMPFMVWVLSGFPDKLSKWLSFRILDQRDFTIRKSRDQVWRSLGRLARTNFRSFTHFRWRSQESR